MGRLGARRQASVMGQDLYASPESTDGCSLIFWHRRSEVAFARRETDPARRASCGPLASLSCLVREPDSPMDPEQTDVGIQNVLGALRRRAPWILLCFLLAAGAAYTYSKHQTRKYTATAAVAFSSNSLSQQIAGLQGGSSANPLVQQANNLELVRLGDMAAKTATLLGHGLTAAKVSEAVSVSGQGESGVADVSATETSPALAAEIANTYSRQFVEEQQSTNRQYFVSALAFVKKQLAELSPAQQTGEDGLNLQNRAQTLTLLAQLDYNNVQVAQEALAPTSPSSPKTSKNTLIGGALGLFIGFGLAFLLEHLDFRIRRPEDLEAIYRVPVLGVVPKSIALARSSRHDGGKTAVLPPAEAEAFSLIRAHLRFFNVDRDLRTIVIASAAADDGKTTMARQLAEAAARSGSRVLLLEADLRHPTLAQQFEIRSGPGLADVLIGAIPMVEATQSVALDETPGHGAKRRTLDVLAAGAVLPPNPGELLESHAMGAVLEQAKSAYDLVVIDTPPLSAVSDAFPLLTEVDSVVIVGWVGRSRRDAAERLHQVLVNSGAPVLGVIANGSKSDGARSYAKAKDEKSPPAGASANGASPSDELIPTAKV
jgi:succinoglycan biosynthesis transport protein ExoP